MNPGIHCGRIEMLAKQHYKGGNEEMPYYMYVTISEEDKILVFTINPETGKLKPLDKVKMVGAPGPLAIDPERRFLYLGCFRTQQIASYQINRSTGGISHIGTAPLEAAPCYLATDRKGRFLLSAYYSVGKIAVHPINEYGVAVTPPVEWIHTSKGAHSIQTDPTNKFVFVPHIADPDGPNLILQYQFNETSGHLTPNSPPSVIPGENDGPRHFCFHPNLDIVYFANEQGCSVTAYHFNPSVGTLSAFQTASTLPDNFKGTSYCSQIQITPSGKFLYAPNRGHNSIACFTVDEDTGRLTSIGQVATESMPRAFSLDPEGNFLFTAGLESSRLASYRINGDNGELEPLETYTVGKAPMWVLTTRLTG